MKHWRDPFQTRPLPMQQFKMQTATDIGVSRAHQQHQYQTVTRHKQLAGQIHQQHQQHHHRIGLHGSKNAHAKINQNACEHGRGDVGRYVFYHPRKQATQAQQQGQQTRKHGRTQSLIQWHA